MEVYLLRHGTAQKARPGMPDSERELAQEGERAIERVARRARVAGVAPELVISSPYLRAAGSAAIAARELGYRGTLDRTPALEPDASPYDAWDEIRARAQGPVLVVAHEPLLSSLAALLLNAPTLGIHMGTACMVAIEVERPAARPNGVLRWMIAPEIA